jgi:hypothetical protein
MQNDHNSLFAVEQPAPAWGDYLLPLVNEGRPMEK